MAPRSEFEKKRWPYVSEKGEQPEEPDFVLIGARFRNGRLAIGMTQAAVARNAGISQSVVSRFERGLVRRSSALNIMRLALALGPDFPLGFCPHDDGCAYPRDAARRPTFWDVFNGRR